MTQSTSGNFLGAWGFAHWNSHRGRLFTPEYSGCLRIHSKVKRAVSFLSQRQTRGRTLVVASEGTGVP